MTVPLEVSTDHEQLLSVAQEEGGFVMEKTMLQQCGWSSDRFLRIVNSMLAEGMLWLDEHAG